MEPRNISHEELCRVITVAVSVVAGVLITAVTSGCSLHMGVDYYGKTGVDNRVQTRLVGSEGGAIDDGPPAATRSKY